MPVTSDRVRANLYANICRMVQRYGRCQLVWYTNDRMIKARLGSGDHGMVPEAAEVLVTYTKQPTREQLDEVIDTHIRLRRAPKSMDDPKLPDGWPRSCSLLSLPVNADDHAPAAA